MFAGSVCIPEFEGNEMNCKTLPARITTVQDVADRFQVTPITVRRWIAAGKLTAYRIAGRSIRLDLDEVDALVEVAPAAEFEVAK